MEAWEREVAKEHVFQPKLSQGTKRIAQANPEIGNQTFLERQSQWEQDRDQASRDRRRAKAKKDGELFRPDIGQSAM